MSTYVLQFSKVHPNAKLPIRKGSWSAEFAIWSCKDQIIGNNIITTLDTGLLPLDLPINRKLIVLPNPELIDKDIKMVSYIDGSDGSTIQVNVVRNTMDSQCLVISKGTLIGYFFIVNVDIPELGLI